MTRARMDAYDVGPAPEGKSWQWINAHELEERAAGGWRAVSCDRVPGDFDHLVLDGVAVVAYQNSVLVERDIAVTAAAHKERIDKAIKQEQDKLEEIKKIITDAYPDSNPDLMFLKTGAEHGQESSEDFDRKADDITGKGAGRKGGKDPGAEGAAGD